MNTSDIYKRDSNTMNFHTKAITKLLDNYRSHPTLLALPSLLFYDNELKACGDKMLTHDMLNWSKLPNKKIPLIFHGIGKFHFVIVFSLQLDELFRET